MRAHRGLQARDREIERVALQERPRQRDRLRRGCDERGARLHFPELALCTDNGAMIALAAAMRLERGIAEPTRDHAFDVLPRWPLVSV